MSIGLLGIIVIAMCGLALLGGAAAVVVFLVARDKEG